MYVCTDRTQSFDPKTLIPNGFCYTFECTSEEDIKELPTPSSDPTLGLSDGSTALVFLKGQDTKLFKLFGKWDGPY